MAKYQHRMFEMYEFRQEAMEALTPKAANLAAEAAAPESWSLKHLSVTKTGSVTHVTFLGSVMSGQENAAELAADFAQLADKLGINSKVLLDFEGMQSFDAAAIEALTLLNKKLRLKGSRIALCCLEPSAKESFFAAN